MLQNVSEQGNVRHMKFDQFIREFEAAVESERGAWAKVKDKLPGSPQYDPKLWEHWRATVAVSDKARRLLVKSVGDDTKF
ncbi:MAG: hypothetical protein NVS2B4_05610 [Ramlibacter sp.]